MIIGIPKDTKEFESRVAITPDSIKKLTKSGHEIWIQSNAGKEASFSDQSYLDAGAKICNSQEETFSSDIILKVNALNSYFVHFHFH